MTTGPSLFAELERLASALREDSGETVKLSLPSVAERVSRHLSVRSDEVAILGLSTRWRHLYFLVPEELRRAGFISLSNPSAIAARTVRENRPEIINNFQAARHLAVLGGANAGAGSATIQKMISAPIPAEARIVGVLQISRKGSDLASCGPDFTSEDLARVLTLCNPLGKLVRYVARE